MKTLKSMFLGVFLVACGSSDDKPAAVAEVPFAEMPDADRLAALQGNWATDLNTNGPVIMFIFEEYTFRVLRAEHVVAHIELSETSGIFDFDSDSITMNATRSTCVGIKEVEAIINSPLSISGDILDLDGLKLQKFIDTSTGPSSAVTVVEGCWNAEGYFKPNEMKALE